MLSARVAYILWRFPVLSETFILNELHELVIANPSLQCSIFSIRRPFDTPVHPNAHKLCHRTVYIPSLFTFKCVKAIIKRIVISPRLFCKGLCRMYVSVASPAFSRGWIIEATKMAEYFGKALLIADTREIKDTDHIHAHYAEGAAVVALFVSCLCDIPFSFTSHAHDLFANKRRKLMKTIFGACSCAVTISEYNKHYIRNCFANLDDKCKVIHCGIDPQRFYFKRKRGKSKTLTMLTVARLVETKGVLETVNACSLIHPAVDFRYVVVGSGPLESDIAAAVDRLGLREQVILCGARAEPEIREFLADADLFVLFCQRGPDDNQDGIPVALMEAMAAGIPVISTRVSGIPELVKNGAGILVEPGDWHSLAAAIKRLWQKDRLFLENMGEKGRKIVRSEFHIQKETAKLAKLFGDGKCTTDSIRKKSRGDSERKCTVLKKT